MQTKQLIAVVAIMAVAAAAIVGTAYAYQANVSSELNTVQSDFIVLNDPTGDFNGYFSSGNTDAQYGTETLNKTTAMFSPSQSTEIYRGLYGKAVGTPLTLSIDSTRMDANNWYTMYVATYDVDGISAHDMKGAFAIKFEYHPSYASTSEVTYTDVVVLDDSAKRAMRGGGGGIPMFMSHQVGGFESTATAGSQFVTLQLYALDYVGAIADDYPKYSNVNFKFMAETYRENTASAISTGTMAVEAYEQDGTTEVTSGVKGLLYLDGALICAASTAVPIISGSHYTASVHVDSSVNSAYAKPYVFRSAAAGAFAPTIKAAEGPTQLVCTAFPTTENRTVASGVADNVSTLLTGLNTGTFNAYYHGAVLGGESPTDVMLTGIRAISSDVTITDGKLTASAGNHRVWVDYTQNGTTASYAMWIIVTA